MLSYGRKMFPDLSLQSRRRRPSEQDADSFVIRVVDSDHHTDTAAPFDPFVPLEQQHADLNLANIDTNFQYRDTQQDGDQSPYSAGYHSPLVPEQSPYPQRSELGHEETLAPLESYFEQISFDNLAHECTPALSPFDFLSSGDSKLFANDSHTTFSFPEPTISDATAASPNYSESAYSNEFTHPHDQQQSHATAHHYAIPNLPELSTVQYSMPDLSHLQQLESHVGQISYPPLSPESPLIQSPHSSGSSHASHLSYDWNAAHSNDTFSNLVPNMESQYLSPPLPDNSLRRVRSTGNWQMGHRATISDGSLDPDQPIPNDLLPNGRRGIIRNRSTGDKPYLRSPSQKPPKGLDGPVNMHTRNISAPVNLPQHNNIKSESTVTVSTSQVATEAMLIASNNRRIHPANFRCQIPPCLATFTTDNSRKRHEMSHGDEKPFTCRFEDCRQAFKNDTDRKRHENTTGKHAGQTLPT